MVLSSESYHFEAESELVPTDLALGWGPMSDSSVLKRLHITQSGRWYEYTYRLPPPIPIAEIVSHSASMHLIP